MFRIVFIAVVATAYPDAEKANAEISTYFDHAQWESTVNVFSTIDFTGFPNGTPIYGQYAPFGVTFTGPSFIAATGAFLNDGWGLHGPSGVRFHFDSPQNWVAVDFPGAVRLNLFFNSELVYSSPFYQPGGLGNFVGLVSTMPFDEVFLDKGPPGPFDVVIDDLHWGGVPGPGALGLAAIAGASTSRRKRRK